jgi:hypothetical protein
MVATLLQSAESFAINGTNIPYNETQVSPNNCDAKATQFALPTTTKREKPEKPQLPTLCSLAAVTFDKHALDAAKRHEKQPSLNVIQPGNWPMIYRALDPKLSAYGYHEAGERRAMIKALNLHNSISKEQVAADHFFVLGCDKPRVSRYLSDRFKGDVSSTKLQPILRLPSSAVGTKNTREFIVDSGASFHMVSFSDLNPEETANLRRRSTPVELTTANGPVTVEWETDVVVVELGNETVTALVMSKSPAVISLGRICRENKFEYHWPQGSRPYLSKKGCPRIYCDIENDVPYTTAAPESTAVDRPDESPVTNETSDSENKDMLPLVDSTDDEAPAPVPTLGKKLRRHP